MRLSSKWWDQPTLDTMEIRAGQVAAEWGGGWGDWSWREMDSRVVADGRERMIW